MAVANSIWAIITTKGWVPEKIILVHDKHTTKTLEPLKKLIYQIVSYSDIAVEFEEKIFTEEDITSIKCAYQEAVKKEKNEGHEVAIDITAGRKSMAAFAMHAGLTGEKKADKIYYTHLDDIERYKNKPFPLIPSGSVIVQDIMDIGSDK